MATITATPTSAPRTRRGVRDRVRAAATRAARQAAQAVSTVRLSPVLTAAALTCGTISAWETFGRGAAWAAAAASLFVFDMAIDRDDD